MTGDLVVDGTITGTITLPADLAAIEALTGTGFAARIAPDTWALRTFTAPAAGFTITNPAGVAGNPTFVLNNDLAALEALSGTNNIYYRSAADTWTSVTIGAGLNFSGGTLSNTVTVGNDLAAIEALTGTGFAARTGVDTWALRTLTPPAAGITITNPAGIAGDPTLALANDLSALEGLSTNGLVTRTATDTMTTRSIAGTTNQITVTNGDGVSGNPVIAVATMQQIPLGTVWDYAGTAAPSGWLFCFGQAISRTTYAALFAITSTTFGVGDGSTTFNLPDLRGRVVAGKDNMGGTSANRLTNPASTIGGLDGDTLGNTGGEEAHAQTTLQMAAHTHNVNVQNSPSADGAALAVRRAAANSGGAGIATTTGSNDAANVVQPTLILNKMIFTGV